MTVQTLFDVTFWLAAPFWLLMIVLPGWSWTRRIVRSPLIVLPPLLVFVVAVLPRLGEFFAAVAQPSYEGVQQLAGSPAGTVAIWAQVIAWDLFVGRWMYLDSRDRGVHALLMAPIMVLTILLSPFGLPIYLAVRRPLTRGGVSREPSRAH